MRNSGAARSAVGCNFRLARSILRHFFRGFAELIAAQSKASSSPVQVCSLLEEAPDIPDITQSKYVYVSAARDNGARALCKYYSTESISRTQLIDHTHPCGVETNPLLKNHWRNRETISPTLPNQVCNQLNQVYPK